MKVADVTDQRILIACLNWGKGHVTRSIGLIQQLLLQNNEIIIAGDKQQISIFKCYFPALEYEEMIGYPFKFSGKGNFALDLWKSRKAIWNAVKLDQIQLEKKVKELNIDLVLSDHRYGFYSKKTRSIFITHQLNLPISWWQKSVQRWHSKQLKHFAEIWVMDTETSVLAGKLSKNISRLNVEYIGYYSRFMYHQFESVKQHTVLVCSGPTPYDEQLFLAYKDKKDILIICSDELILKYPTLNVFPASNWKENDMLIAKAKKIYSYSGYSTLMDLQFLKCESELQATRGQSEQQYLLKLHPNK